MTNTKIILIITILFTASCVQKPAKIELKGDEVYDLDSDIWYNKIEQLEKKFITYVVQPGDSIASIAREYNLNFLDLVEVNKLDDSYNISPRQILYYPFKKSYFAKSDDSIVIVANKFDISPKAIIRLNNLSVPYELHKNQHLTVLYKKKETINSTSASANKKVVQKIQDNKKVEILTTNHKFIWPLNGKIKTRFGKKENGVKHDGINIVAPLNSPVKATMNGEVIYHSDSLGNYGRVVIIKHPGNWYSAYAHLKSINVVKGEQIKSGQVIGNVGSTGRVDGPELHFALRKNKIPYDPEKLLPKKINVR